VLGKIGPNQTFMMNAMPHELVHILTDKVSNGGHYAAFPSGRQRGSCNLMWPEGPFDAGVLSGKRLWLEQDNSTPPFKQVDAIYRSPYLYKK